MKAKEKEKKRGSKMKKMQSFSWKTASVDRKKTQVIWNWKSIFESLLTWQLFLNCSERKIEREKKKDNFLREIPTQIDKLEENLNFIYFPLQKHASQLLENRWLIVSESNPIVNTGITGTCVKKQFHRCKSAQYHIWWSEVRSLDTCLQGVLLLFKLSVLFSLRLTFVKVEFGSIRF